MHGPSPFHRVDCEWQPRPLKSYEGSSPFSGADQGSPSKTESPIPSTTRLNCIPTAKTLSPWERVSYVSNPSFPRCEPLPHRSQARTLLPVGPHPRISLAPHSLLSTLTVSSFARLLYSASVSIERFCLVYEAAHAPTPVHSNGFPHVCADRRFALDSFRQ